MPTIQASQNPTGLLRFRPPRIAMTYLGIVLTIYWFSPERQYWHQPLPSVGIPLLLIGVCLMFWAWGWFQNKNAEICPLATSSILVAEGPYRWSRNPMYLAMVLMLIGSAFWMGTASAFLAPLAMFLTLDRVFIPYEEQDLAATFGTAYQEYQQQVRRWI